MLDFSWSELLVVIIVAVFAIGPKQLPALLYGLGRIIRRLQYMRYAVTRQFDDFMAETDLQDINRVGGRFNQSVMHDTAFHSTAQDEADLDQDVIDVQPKADV